MKAATRQGLRVGFYNDVLLPRLLDRAMRNEELVGYRRRVVGAAHGRVLEIGLGSGLNLPFYGPGVTEIIGLDPSRRLIGMASRRAGENDRALSLLTASAEANPLDTGSVDTIVTTWTMCSIPDARTAPAEMRRVLRPAGSFCSCGSSLTDDQRSHPLQPLREIPDV